MKSFKGLKTRLKINGNDPEKDKYFDLATNANNWRRISLSLIIIILFLSGGLIKVATEKKVKTFVLEKNGYNYKVLGNMNDLVEKQNNHISEREIIYFLNKVIEDTKSLPPNTSVYEKNYKRSLNFLSKTAAKKIDNYLKTENYVQKVERGKTVEIKFNTGTKLDDNTYQLRWKQITYNKSGEVENEINYASIITISFVEINDPKTLYINPIGLMITDFSQKQELL